MKNIMLFNDKWSFLKTEPGAELPGIQGREGEFRPVDLPHDWLIYNTHNLYENSTGWYRKCITARLVSDEALAETAQENDTDTLCIMPGERVILRFDGVYMDSTFYVNRRKVGDWKYGYSAFDYDITEYLQQGENELLMQVRHQSPNSRWYSCPQLRFLFGQSQILRSETHIRKHIDLKQLVLRILKYQPYLASQFLLIIFLRVDIFPVKIYIAAGWLDQSI